MRSVTACTSVANGKKTMTASSAAPRLPLLRRDDDAGVVTLTLAAPQNRNALGLAMIDTLIVAFADIAKDEKARVVVLTGEGPALSSGHDMKEIQAHRNDADRGRDYYEELLARCAVLMQAIVALPKPVIAAVEGVATAAGLNSSPPAISRSLASRRDSPFPASTSASSVLRRWWRSAARCRANTPWRWR